MFLITNCTNSFFKERWRALNEIDAGDMENMTYQQIQERLDITGIKFILFLYLLHIYFH